MSEARASRSTDARATRTRAALRAAFVSLIAEKPYELISVREIALGAGVTFPTFYRQFATKEALLAEIARDEIADMAAMMTLRRDQDNAARSAGAICAYVGENRVLWSTLLATSAAAVMREEFVRRSEAWAEASERINPDLPADMVASFIVSSLFDILGWWLRQPADYPVERISHYLERLVLAPATKQGAGL